MCKYLFSIEISFFIKFFTFFLYLSFLCVRICLVWEFLFILNFLLFLYLSFLCVSIWSGCVIVCVINKVCYYNRVYLFGMGISFFLLFYTYHFYV